mmetsp:Transcript_40174/g.107699  ORF Transcript_40174/g.107699 Transcript_40174/m.107699 type:complete len:216 (-) Transcript_40174:710-1357(-)
MQGSRFQVVASAIGLVAIVALLVLAYDSSNATGTELVQESLDDDAAELHAIKQQQQELIQKEKKLEAKLAAKKIASKQDAKIAKLKQELAAAEADKSKSVDSDNDSESDSSESTEAPAKKPSAKVSIHGLVTAQDFKQLSEGEGKVADKKIAKEAGLREMGWMGSKDAIDDTLRKYGCDPTSFVCKGSRAQRKIIAKKLQELQVASKLIFFVAVR